MNRTFSFWRYTLAITVIFGAMTSVPILGGAQSGADVTKTTAKLLPPTGASDQSPTGKAITQYKDKGGAVSQKLAITLQHLERKTDYQIVIDGIELGTYSPKGNSGTLVVRFRDPVKGHQTQLPIEVGPVQDMQLIQVFNVDTGDLVLEGMFEVSEN